MFKIYGGVGVIFGLSKEKYVLKEENNRDGQYSKVVSGGVFFSTKKEAVISNN